MNTLAKKEAFIIGLIVVLFILLFIPALLHSRAEKRDGIRRDEIAERKTDLELYFNDHDAYPLEFDASPHHYVVTERDQSGATHWFLRAVLENPADTGAHYDAESGRNYYYRVQQVDGQTVYDVCGGGPDCPL